MDFFETDPFAAPVDEILERNLDALARTSPVAARQIRAATARADLDFHETDEDALSASFQDGRLLASRRKPVTEATRLADTVDITEVAGVAVPPLRRAPQNPKTSVAQFSTSVAAWRECTMNNTSQNVR